MTLDDIHIVELPKIMDRRGNLSFIEGDVHLPFNIERTYFMYDVPGGEARGGHAYCVAHEFIIALSGSFDVVLNDGVSQKTISLNRSYYGVHVPQMIWRQLNNFSTNSVALILTSTSYDEKDYIRDFKTYLAKI